MPRRVRLNAVQTLTAGFALLILIGGALLSFPLAARNGQAVAFEDALFTAASASCVTGLSLFDTASRFSLFGQAVILLLIQIGGLGFMTVSTLVSVLLRQRVGLHRRGGGAGPGGGPPPGGRPPPPPPGPPRPPVLGGGGGC